MSVIIDAGHGGKDPGAVSNGIRESDLTLKISLYQQKRFKELGVPVKMTRTTDYTMSIDHRSKVIKDSGMKHCICNHINAGGGDGSEVIYSIYGSNKMPLMVLDHLKAVGQNARRVFTRTLPNNPKADYYGVHRNTGAVETWIIEYGFLDSKADDVMQLKTHWETFAEAVVKAYCSYAGYKYTTPAKQKPPMNGGGNVPKTRYSDVPKNHSNYDNIERAAELGLMNGYGDGTFKPDTPLTRSQLATVAVRLHDKLNKK